ncbi:MAG: flavin reductase family protein [Eubacterium sp.]|nr:flavin reductase family protein [Eubacterium sp.]
MDKKIMMQKPGNMLYPVPAVMVSMAGEPEQESDGLYREKSDLAHYPAAGIPNIITVAWAGTICSDPPMVSVSVRRSRYSWHLLKQHGEFVINLTTEKLVKAADLCGVRSGRDIDKFGYCHLTPGAAKRVNAPIIEESPVNIECMVKEVLPLGSHDMFLAEVVCVQVDQAYMDDRGGFHLEDAGLAVYSHGEYYGLGKMLGTFGYSVRKPQKKKPRRRPQKK